MHLERNYRLGRQLSFIPPFQVNSHIVEVGKVEFHPSLPLVIVFYTEKPIPWNRVLVFRICQHNLTLQLIYNASLYAKVPGILMKSYLFHFILFLRMLLKKFGLFVEYAISVCCSFVFKLNDGKFDIAGMSGNHY